MIDLSGMRTVTVDPAQRTASVGAGALLADFDREAQAHGLATPLGINSTTGVAGLTLGVSVIVAGSTSVALKSDPVTKAIFGDFINATAAEATSRKLCDGISVAIPTAIPEAPLSNTNGKRAGNNFGS